MGHAARSAAASAGADYDVSDVREAAVTAATVERLAQARLRAMSQCSHFGSSANGGETFCDRCGKPLNRWDEKCEYQPDLAHLLAEDVLWLLDLPVVRALA